MQSSSKNSEKKRDKRDTKEVSQSDLSKNQKCVNDVTRFNHVDLQAWKRRCCTARSKLRSLSSSEKVLEMSEENCRLSACNALKLHDIDTWYMHHTEHKQSEDDHQKIDERQCKTSWRFKDVKNSLTQEDSWKWKDSLITHCRDCNQNDDELTIEHEHAKLVSRMLMQIIWKELSYHTVLQVLWF